LALPYRSLLNQRQDIAEFIDHLVYEYHFDKAQLNAIFKEAQIIPEIIEHMNKPAEAKPWFIYKDHFLTSKRIKLGAQFWDQHRTALERAYKEYGVPPEIIVAILGVETNYGEIQGNYRVIDSLVTLAFEYPPRAHYFKKELVQFLLLCREQQEDPLSIKGSYAGAIGQSQFMPSAYRYYAVDFTGDGKKDLRNNSLDAIGSIANYLAKNGWSKNQTIIIKADVKGDAYKRFLRKKAKPLFSIKELKQHGVIPDTKVAQKTLASVINLEGEKKPEFWLGFHNFYVITRYNASQLYAMAVTELGAEIKKSRKG
jgi:membrane-bound lytic murein transglycosylase B